MSKTLVTYPDGTEFTTTHFAVAFVAGGVIAFGHSAVKRKVNRTRTKRYMKKHSWPQAAVDRI